MAKRINNTQASKDVMAINISQHMTLPTKFGKCLELPRLDPRILRINEKTSHPKEELKGSVLIPYAESHFDLKGRLEIDEREFLYINLDNQHIYDLFERLDCAGAELPPYFSSQKSYGAHISVALSSETFNVCDIPHLGKEVSFSITGCYSVRPENWENVKRVWFLTINAPELSIIRTQLGLSSKIMDHEFHITFAIEKEYLTLDDFLTISSEKKIVVNHTKALQRKIRQMRRSLSENKV